MVAGLVVAGAMVVAMQLPLLHQPSTSSVSLAALSVPAPRHVAWPATASAALLIPALGVQRTSNDRVVPIASLTKMMTAYVVLAALPLSVGATGPCLTVTRDDVLVYDQMQATNQSSAAVAAGETLCEATLLDGLLVHSASNYALLLARLTWGDEATFVARMNTDAAALGLTHTRYVDVSGYLPGSVSTALEQARLAAIIMRSPVVRAIVDQSSVTLPVAGTLGSYTPYVGIDHVVGVKSGRTDAAGGCDVMAMTFVVAGQTQLAYAVVLGARGGDLLGPAGDEALALAQSVLNSEHTLRVDAGAVVGTLGWGSRYSDVVTENPLTLQWFTALHGANVSVHIYPQTSLVRPGTVVGWLEVTAGSLHRVALTVAHAISPETLLERLR